MKHFYSHALMLLVKLPDDRPPCRIMQNEIIPQVMDQQINRSAVSGRQSLPINDIGRGPFS